MSMEAAVYCESESVSSAVDLCSAVEVIFLHRVSGISLRKRESSVIQEELRVEPLLPLHRREPVEVVQVYD